MLQRPVLAIRTQDMDVTVTSGLPDTDGDAAAVRRPRRLIILPVLYSAAKILDAPRLEVEPDEFCSSAAYLHQQQLAAIRRPAHIAHAQALRHRPPAPSLQVIN